MKRIITYYFFLIVAWVAAWLLYQQVGLTTQSALVQFVYWTIAKLIIWILPIVLIIKKQTKQPLAKYLLLTNQRSGVKVGIIFGLIFIGVSFILDYFTRSFLWPQVTIGLFSALFVAPLLEEIVFRGYLLASLEKATSRFWLSNLIAAVLFLGIHIPGWYFMKSANISQPIVMISIVAIGMIAGYAKKKANSTWASIMFHFINNLYSAFIR